MIEKKYIGYFWFRPSVNEKQEHSFSAIVKASDPEQAADRFRTLIKNMHNSIDALESGADVFIEEMIEFEDVPEEGSLLRLEISRPEINGILSLSLAYPKNNPMSSFGVGDPEGVIEPFLTLPDIR